MAIQQMDLVDATQKFARIHVYRPLLNGCRGACGYSLCPARRRWKGIMSPQERELCAEAVRRCWKSRKRWSIQRAVDRQPIRFPVQLNRPNLDFQGVCRHSGVW
ncbi:hypothetical protein KCP69_08195 [Salmonella enterica subsp. enterica]|nr:hypothetical protein KCP69_08195 [Salmonella enterica subsp. enterica]